MLEVRPFSVMFGKDCQILPILINLHAVENPKILDCTYNRGVMWKGTEFKPVRMDINPEYDLDVVGDFRKMPFDNESFDIIVADPPHNPSAQDNASSSINFDQRYGCSDISTGRDGDNINDLFEPLLLETKRVLKKDGIMLAKIADLTHNHKYQWQHVDFINAVRKIEMTPCDLLIKRDPNGGKITSSKWKNIKHLRKCHCYWIVVRNSNKCEKK